MIFLRAIAIINPTIAKMVSNPDISNLGLNIGVIVKIVL